MDKEAEVSLDNPLPHSSTTPLPDPPPSYLGLSPYYPCYNLLPKGGKGGPRDASHLLRKGALCRHQVELDSVGRLTVAGMDEVRRVFHDLDLQATQITGPV